LKGQLIVGKGGIPIPSVPGTTAPLFPDTYPTQEEMYPKEVAALKAAKAKAAATLAVGKTGGSFISGTLLIGIVVGLLLTPILAQRYKGQTAGQVVTDLFGMAAFATRQVIVYGKRMSNMVLSLINKPST